MTKRDLTDFCLDFSAEGFPKCKRDANFDKCLVDAVNVAIQQLKAGE